MLVQSALLGAGSLDPRLVKALRARPSVARRYLALEGRRVLAELARQIPLAAALRLTGNRAPRPPTSHSRWPGPERRSPTRRSGSVSSSPPGCWRRPPDRAGRPPTRTCVCSSIPSTCPKRRTTTTKTTTRESGESKILKLFENPLFNSQALVGLPAQVVRRLAFPRRGRCRRRDAGSLHSAGAGGRSECPASAHPDPIHRRRQARRRRRRGRRPVSGVGRPQQPVPAGMVPGHRLSADRRRRCLRRRCPAR